MDQITRALLDEFVEQNSLQTLHDSVAFEHFAGYLVTSAHYEESLSTDDIAVGAGGDCGIDCIFCWRILDSAPRFCSGVASFERFSCLQEQSYLLVSGRVGRKNHFKFAVSHRAAPGYPSICDMVSGSVDGNMSKNFHFTVGDFLTISRAAR